MKKKPNYWPLAMKEGNLIFLKMKLTVFLSLMLFFTSWGSSLSQTVKLSLDLRNVPVEKVIQLIEEQTEFYFLYQDDVFRQGQTVTIQVKNTPVENILQEFAGQASVEYRIIDRQIVLLPAEKPVQQTAEPAMAEQQRREITGIVRDGSGSPLPGVTVVVKGTTTGTVSGSDGAFSLQVPADATTLVFSFVGMKSQEVSIVGTNTANVVMQEETLGIEEVVAIGYGTQKKANLTGSVAFVAGSELSKRPAPNVQNLLQGKVSGMRITQRGGTPGQDAGEIRIRGLGTFSGTGSNPLVLIDGVEGDMTDLDPNIVESVSVLKDAASAAIYGARAANGVILITTKRGKAEAVAVEYHVSLEAQDATRLPKLLTNSARYMELWNEANARAGMGQWFTQAEIDAFRNNPNDPVRYPNFDWVDYMFKTAFVHNHSLSVNGGNEKTRFNVSLGYLDQGGITEGYDFKRYNVLFSLDTEVTDWLTIGGNMQGLKKDMLQDVQGTHVESYWIMHTYAPGPNYTPTMTLPDGSTGFVARYSDKISEWTVRNPMAILAAGTNMTNNYNVRPMIYADVKLTKDLTWYTKGATDFDYTFRKNHEHAVNNYYFKDGTYAHNGAVWNLGVRDAMSTAFLTTFYSTLNFDKTIGTDHSVGALAGYNQESAYYRSLNGNRTYFPTDNLKELNAGSSLNQSTSGTASEWAIQSLFGRVTYDFKGKYLFEANARYDGTSRIAPDTRWGFFPSLSGAWRISEESFMKSVSWLDNLKFRASWGELGNQNVGTYPYQDILSTSSYIFGALETGVRPTRLVDKKLKWETTAITDFGVDLSIKNGLFTMTADWYNKLTSDILYSIPVPASVGLSAPTINGGKMKNTGWEIELGHANKIGDIRYSVDFNISTYKNEVVSILSPTYGQRIIKEGLPYNAWYLVEWIGIFQDQAEIDAGPVHPFNPKPGDLKYKDQLTIDTNGDGVPDKADGVINADDRVVVDGAHPKFFYGGSLNLFWKNLDFTAFFQGVEGLMNYATHWGITPYTQGSPPPVDFVENMWTTSNKTNKYPAIYRSGYGPVDGTNSTYHLKDASYLRLKNLRLGYTLPTEFAQRLGMKGAQVYFSGDNLITFSKYPGADPERVSSGQYSVYPQLRTLAFGIKVKL
jgi:TonB-linked SusC/RagA family outer membrane protein